MASLVSVLTLCSLLCRSVAVTCGDVSTCNRTSDLSPCAITTYGVSLLRASAFKSKAKVVAEWPEEEASVHPVPEVQRDRHKELMRKADPPPGAAEVHHETNASPRKADPPPGAPEVHHEASPSPRKVVAYPQLLQRFWFSHLWPSRPERKESVVPAPLVALAVVMVAAATATAVAAGVAVTTVRKLKAAEKQQQPMPGPHHISGLPGEAESLSEQEAKIKTVNHDTQGCHHWEELSEPEAEWDAHSAASSNS
mmetsp:Transcript_34244/g.79684  ORF Transcript_34244/g.79684 Transcript_34244/m.79684 type:complete len:253 (+) Transcript_34244:60-818(+)